jgi:hypothetical protein
MKDLSANDLDDLYTVAQGVQENGEDDEPVLLNQYLMLFSTVVD